MHLNQPIDLVVNTLFDHLASAMSAGEALLKLHRECRSVEGKEHAAVDDYRQLGRRIYQLDLAMLLSLIQARDSAGDVVSLEGQLSEAVGQFVKCTAPLFSNLEHDDHRAKPTASVAKMTDSPAFRVNQVPRLVDLDCDAFKRQFRVGGRIGLDEVMNAVTRLQNDLDSWLTTDADNGSEIKSIEFRIADHRPASPPPLGHAAAA